MLTSFILPMVSKHGSESQIEWQSGHTTNFVKDSTLTPAIALSCLTFVGKFFANMESGSVHNSRKKSRVVHKCQECSNAVV